MSPNISFRLDAEGYSRCASLLEAAGMQFVAPPPEAHPPFPPIPAMASTSGQLVSPRGTFLCKLIECEGRYRFVLTVHGESDTILGILDDVERAFAGHLLERNETVAS